MKVNKMLQKHAKLPILGSKFAMLSNSTPNVAALAGAAYRILPYLGALGPHLVAKLLEDGAQPSQHSITSR